MTLSLEALATRTTRPWTHLSMSDLQRELTRCTHLFVGGIRGLLFVIGLLLFGAQSELAIEKHMLALTLALIGLTLVLTLVQRQPTRIGFALDVCAVALLVQSTGGAHSPYLCVSLLLILQGAAIGGRRDALAGGGFGVVLLLLTIATHPSYSGTLVIVLVALHLISAIAVAWLCALGAAMLHLLHHEDAARGNDTPTSAALDWEAVNTALARCADQAALARVASEQAHGLAGVSAHITLGEDTTGGAGSNAETLVLPFAHGETCGLLTLNCVASALTNEQHSALRRLTSLVGVYAALLDTTAQVQCQQDVMATLWQVSDFLRLAPQFDAALLETSRHMVQALQLDWLVLLAPDERRALTPLLIVPGENNRRPQLAGKPFQYALETLHTGNPQVRDEHGRFLIFLPLAHTAGAPLVLVASAPTAAATTQTALMLFGSLVAEGFMTRSLPTAASTGTVSRTYTLARG